ncbi:daunorubicin ABC transporter ATP-binding protein [Exiguobacterium sp. SH31]|uniref:ATP-binding cassette domain-containing protein n=1 Tax=unclassified Exiguobacterium TaxID=2644629 RepID=UPI0008B3C188|nr:MULTISPECIES: ATP-binding cassette domain-containing protein [unclassified Exiguobacterium]OGX79490.1 daunorubicin ABC transporter ATP-binding protein [Exiguobacterium sp. SH31]TCI70521.1 ATP-binding cassette domain-containing protein [Exiguobacterium sp. SH0S7]
MIEVESLVKTFGDVPAVDGISFSVKQGEIFAFLGPNGAGKSTAIQMLTTLIRPTSGSARVNGFDVVKREKDVRLSIGVALQETGIDKVLTGRELLVLQGRLFKMTKREAEARAEELLSVVSLAEAADRKSGTYSGGMRRRLDLALTLVHRPIVLFLDEPTTGLDPASRIEIWKEVRRLNQEFGTTIFLTTQYLEEADELADRIAIIHHGKIVVEGTAEELKQTVGGESISLVFHTDSEARAAAELFGQTAAGPSLVFELHDYTLTDVVRKLDEQALQPERLTVKQPSLDDVFLKVTGESYEGGVPSVD